eukprot:jgi/Picsp_1/1165/NSC_04646-R1_---NA---
MGSFQSLLELISSLLFSGYKLFRKRHFNDSIGFFCSVCSAGSLNRCFSQIIHLGL